MFLRKMQHRLERGDRLINKKDISDEGRKDKLIERRAMYSDIMLLEDMSSLISTLNQYDNDVFFNIDLIKKLTNEIVNIYLKNSFSKDQDEFINTIQDNIYENI